ncbi:hypothetical protein VTN96DRAFT_4120 [Rasamsonia emersonii]
MWVARLAQEAVYELGAQLAGSLSGELMPNESTIEAYAEEALNLLMEWGPEKRTEWSNPRELDHGFTFERYLAINNRLDAFGSKLFHEAVSVLRRHYSMRLEKPEVHVEIELDHTSPEYIRSDMLDFYNSRPTE